MAKNNRTEFASDTTTSFPDASAIKATALRDQQISNLSESVVMKKDVISETDKAGETSIIADFSSADTLVFTNINQNITITATGLADGERAFIVIASKAITNTITWGGGIVDNSLSPSYINTKLSSVTYEIVQKDGNVYVIAQSANLLEATAQEILDATANKFITPEKFQTNVWYEVGNDGGLTTYTIGWAGQSANPLSWMYKKDGGIVLRGVAEASVTISSPEIFTFAGVDVGTTLDAYGSSWFYDSSAGTTELKRTVLSSSSFVVTTAASGDVLELINFETYKD